MTEQITQDSDPAQLPTGLSTNVWRRFRKNKPSFIALVVLILLFVGGMGYWGLHLAGIHWPADPTKPDPPSQFQSPSIHHPLGTDDLGRDVLARVLLGAHVSLLIGFVAVGISVTIGVIIGSISGYFGGWLDTIIMRFVDMMMCIPTFFLILTVAALVRPSIWYIALMIGLTRWTGTSRLVRAEFLTLRSVDYVQAARATGAKPLRIIFRHILPNALPPSSLVPCSVYPVLFSRRHRLVTWVSVFSRPTPVGATS